VLFHVKIDEYKRLLKFVLLFKKNYFLGEFFLVLAIIAGYLSQIKGRRIQKRNFLEAKISLLYSFVRNLNSF